jgi:hypothetical protein
MDAYAVLALSIAGPVGLGTLFVLATARQVDEARAVSAAVASPSEQRARSELVAAGAGAAGRPSGPPGQRAVALEEMEAAFIEVAAPYGARKGLTYEAWRSIGLAPRVLKAAGIGRGQ